MNDARFRWGFAAFTQRLRAPSRRSGDRRSRAEHNMMIKGKKWTGAALPITEGKVLERLPQGHGRSNYNRLHLDLLAFLVSVSVSAHKRCAVAGCHDGD